MIVKTCVCVFVFMYFYWWTSTKWDFLWIRMTKSNMSTS